MAKKPKKKVPLKVVTEDDPPARPYYFTPSPWYLKADTLRLNYWRAIRSGEIASTVAAALQAWKDHLHVPRTKRKT